MHWIHADCTGFMQSVCRFRRATHNSRASPCGQPGFERPPVDNFRRLSGAVATIERMPHLQIRDLEPETINALRGHAAAEDLSMAQFLRRELRRVASTACAAELLSSADDRRERLGGGVDRERFAAAIDSM